MLIVTCNEVIEGRTLHTVSLVSVSLSPQMVLPASLASVRNTLVPYLELTTVNIIYPLIDNLKYGMPYTY